MTISLKPDTALSGRINPRVAASEDCEAGCVYCTCPETD